MTTPEYDGRLPAPIPHGSRRDIDEAAPGRRHTERQPGESYPDALSRVAGERDAALQDVARLREQVASAREEFDRWARNQASSAGPYYGRAAIRVLDDAAGGPAGEKP
jgi:hypothetical protein